MELSGFTFKGPLTGEAEQYVALGPMSVMFGANDVGKSRALRLFHDALADTGRKSPGPPLEGNVGWVFFQVGGWQLRDVLRRSWQDAAEGLAVVDGGQPDRDDLPFEVAGRTRAVVSWNQGEQLLASVEFDPLVDPIPYWIEVLRFAFELWEPEWNEAFELLERSPTLATTPHESGKWMLMWCLPSWGELPERVQVHLDAELPVGARPRDENMPIPFASAAAELFDPHGLPSIVWAPGRPEGKGKGAATAIYAFASALTGRRMLRTEPERGEQIVNLAIRGSRFTVTPESADIAFAARILRWRAEQLLPPFVAERYRLRIGVKATDTKTDTTLALVDRRTGESFGFDAAADGLQLWLDIALSEAIAMMEPVHEALAAATYEDEDRDLLLRLADRAHDDFGDPDDLHVPDAVEAAKRVRDRWEARRATDLAEFLRGDEDIPLSIVIPGPRTRVYVIDEPERHLNPRLQRDAAHWLYDLTVEEGAQAVVTSHSAAFLGLPDAAFTAIQRDRVTTASPLRPHMIRAQETFAREVGLDRGELLGLQRLVLFVEGVTDEAFLHGYYSTDLRARGVIVSVLHGHKGTANALGVLDVVLRFTSLPAAVLLDAVGELYGAPLTSPMIAALSADDVSPTDEVKALKRLLDRATELGIGIDAYGIPTKDIFHLVPDDVVDEVLRKKHTFPGHEDAMAEAATSGGNWKKLYLDRYGIDVFDPETFRRAGAAMRDRGVRCEAIDRILDELAP